MTISRRSDYAVRALVDMAAQGDGGPYRVAEIARRQSVPMPFLAKIVQQLVAAGLLQTRRGKGGGVYLAANADSVTILDVVQAIDGPLDLNWCTAEPRRCDRWQGCAVHPAWVSAQRLLEQVLAEARITDLAQAQRRLDAALAAQTAESGEERT
ncbi:MAG: RrF2 family transcriptional regulator [Dehalococcoidia bacterium]